MKTVSGFNRAMAERFNQVADLETIKTIESLHLQLIKQQEIIANLTELVDLQLLH